jgi:zinc/manganese transport system substrate-binding protein
VPRTRTTVSPGAALAAVLLAALMTLPACSSGTDGAPGSSAPVPGGPCPVAAVPVVVAVDQWRDLVQHLAGRCATVTTVVTGTSVDPHDYEPTPADGAALGDARLIVVNGLGYDRWASAAAAARRPEPALVDAAAAGGAREGDNPHRWYRPADVEATGRAVTAELRRLLPGAEAYLDERSAAWNAELAPWTDLVAAVRARHGGRRYAATEPVFALLGEALGLADVTPPGFAAATANGSDPSPGDLAAFQGVLRGDAVDVLVYNTQTQGSVPEQLRAAADAAGVPVVEVTETVAPGQPSFVAWQVDQLQRLDRALGGTR